jgi:hypothetical protein
MGISLFCLSNVVMEHVLGFMTRVGIRSDVSTIQVAPSSKPVKGAPDQSPVPKYFVELEKAGHFAWADIGIIAHEQIIAYSLAFMNHYVKGEPAKQSLTKKSPVSL